MLRRGFTIIELLIVVAIVGTMMAVAVSSVVSGRNQAQITAATRSVHQLIRHARSLALLKQHPVVLTYTDGGDDAPSTLKMELGDAEVGAATAAPVVRTTSDEEDEDVYKPDEDVMEKIERKFEGMRFLTEEREDAPRDRQSKISVFSNVDFILGARREQSRVDSEAENGISSESGDDAEEAKSPAICEPLTVIFEPNGMCQPHRVVVYPDQADPDSGIGIEVDRFGKAVVDDDEKKR